MYSTARQLNKLQQGFTLIEIMVVVVILSILAAFIVPNLMDRPDQARITKARQDIRMLESALEMYRLDNFQYPTADQGLHALTENPGGDNANNWKKGGYVRKLTKDPWGNDYVYLNPGDHGEIDIYSLGADGQPGGEGVNSDIGNWDLQ